MWVSEMSNHCGLTAWQQNTRIVHAVSDTPDGKYRFVNEVIPTFAANPAVVRGENGEYIMLFEHSWPPPCNYSKCTCSNGSTTQVCEEAMAAKHCNFNTARWPSYMAYATNPNGPWSTPELIPAYRDEGDQGDFNLSPVIFQNGSALLMYRYGGGTPYNSHLRLGWADHWRNVSSYRQHNATNIFPNQTSGGMEDPMLYRDNKGHFHALVHSMVGETTCHRLGALDGRGSCGAHLFSYTGYDWHYVNDHGMYNGTIVYTEETGMDMEEGGVKATVIRRERPYGIMQQDLHSGNDYECSPGIYQPCGELHALLTASMYPPGDGTFTLLSRLGKE